ncbi:MAG TPA: S-adenosylmethionine:tRNA ribosyltransferase-isomerase [Vicinamibacterales bacterium]|jgi:S-adenosylmethionine:tRNA ribosyltransferase-isomerase
MIPATVAVQRPADARLLVVDAAGCITHRRRADFPSFVASGDLVIANDAATLPASLSGTHQATSSPVELRLAGRRSILARDVRRFIAVAFGAGDFRTPTERRPLPPTIRPGDVLQLGPLRARVRNVLGHPRLIEIDFDGSVEGIWEGLARHGRPIQYAHLGQPLAIWDTWTRIASRPVAFEPPSAGFILDWRVIAALRARGAAFATITHAAGISSTGDPDLDALLPLDEPYDIPTSTAALIDATRRRDRRIIAIGTTVVRALEDAAARDGRVRSGPEVATLRVGPLTPLRIVDALVTGQHEPGTSHFELLRAFQDDGVLRQVIAEAEAHSYRTHEFGDSLLVANRNAKFKMQNAKRSPSFEESPSPFAF